MQLCSSLSILWHCLSLGLEWKLTYKTDYKFGPWKWQETELWWYVKKCSFVTKSTVGGLLKKKKEAERSFFNSVPFYSNPQGLIESLFSESHCARAIGNILGHISKCNKGISAQLVFSKICVVLKHTDHSTTMLILWAQTSNCVRISHHTYFLTRLNNQVVR